MERNLEQCKLAPPERHHWVADAGGMTYKVDAWAAFPDGAVHPVSDGELIDNTYFNVEQFEERARVWRQLWGTESCTQH